MTAADMIDDLIGRLKRAAAADRDLDARISYAVKPALQRMGTLEQWLLTSAATKTPNYTWSIDDALTLVPVSWGFNVSDRAPEPHAGRAWIHNKKMIACRAYRGAEATAVTPAIAICIAVMMERADAMADADSAAQVTKQGTADASTAGTQEQK